MLFTLFVGAVCLYLVYRYLFKSNSTPKPRIIGDHAIVIGSSFSGMVAAANLAKCFKRVTIIERDDVISELTSYGNLSPSELFEARCKLTKGRGGAAQSVQPHVVMKKARDLWKNIFPKLEQRLLEE